VFCGLAVSRSVPALRQPPTSSPDRTVARLRSLEVDIVSLLIKIDAGQSLPPPVRDHWLGALCAISWVIESPEGLELTTAGRHALADAKAGWLNHKGASAHAG
jgi:hypothetical protein